MTNTNLTLVNYQMINDILSTNFVKNVNRQLRIDTYVNNQYTVIVENNKNIVVFDKLLNKLFMDLKIAYSSILQSRNTSLTSHIR